MIIWASWARLVTADHPYADPGDGRTECDTCGKWVFKVTHSCKGVPVTQAARQRMLGGDGHDVVFPRTPSEHVCPCGGTFNRVGQTTLLVCVDCGDTGYLVPVRDEPLREGDQGGGAR